MDGYTLIYLTNSSISSFADTMWVFYISHPNRMLVLKEFEITKVKVALFLPTVYIIYACQLRSESRNLTAIGFL